MFNRNMLFAEQQLNRRKIGDFSDHPGLQSIWLDRKFRNSELVREADAYVYGGLRVACETMIENFQYNPELGNSHACIKEGDTWIYDPNSAQHCQSYQILKQMMDTVGREKLDPTQSKMSPVLSEKLSFVCEVPTAQAVAEVVAPQHSEMSWWYAMIVAPMQVLQFSFISLLLSRLGLSHRSEAIEPQQAIVIEEAVTPVSDGTDELSLPPADDQQDNAAAAEPDVSDLKTVMRI
jgi:hypothetical protein